MKGLKESTRSVWKELVPKIISQAQLECQGSGVASVQRCVYCMYAFRLATMGIAG